MGHMNDILRHPVQNRNSMRKWRRKGGSVNPTPRKNPDREVRNQENDKTMFLESDQMFMHHATFREEKREW